MALLFQDLDICHRKFIHVHVQWDFRPFVIVKLHQNHKWWMEKALPCQVSAETQKIDYGMEVG